jgi:hypothetical protein
MAGAGVSARAAAIATGVLKNMLLSKLKTASALLLTVALTAGGVGRLVTLPAAAQPAAPQPAGREVLGVFAGSSPCDASVRTLLQIPPGPDAHLIQWKLALYQHPGTRAPAGYELRCKYGLTVPGQPGLDRDARTLERQGRWSIAKGTKSNPDAVVYALDGAVSFFRVDPNVLHALDRDGSLLVGGGGWSYTFYRADALETPVDPSLEAGRPSESYTLPPVPTGPSVFGVFGGRSPCRGIARELKVSGAEHRPRVKWRVTLFQDPETGAPTTYRVESCLHRQPAREGRWTLLRGAASDPKAVVYRLDATKTEPALFLLRGDDNVLFFLDGSRKPLVGNADFSYTLNRKKAGG